MSWWGKSAEQLAFEEALAREKEAMDKLFKDGILSEDGAIMLYNCLQPHVYAWLESSFTCKSIIGKKTNKFGKVEKNVTYLCKPKPVAERIHPIYGALTDDQASYLRSNAKYDRTFGIDQEAAMDFNNFVFTILKNNQTAENREARLNLYEQIAECLNDDRETQVRRIGYADRGTLQWVEDYKRQSALNQRYYSAIQMLGVLTGAANRVPYTFPKKESQFIPQKTYPVGTLWEDIGKQIQQQIQDAKSKFVTNVQSNIKYQKALKQKKIYDRSISPGPSDARKAGKYSTREQSHDTIQQREQKKNRINKQMGKKAFRRTPPPQSELPEVKSTKTLVDAASRMEWQTGGGKKTKKGKKTKHGKKSHLKKNKTKRVHSKKHGKGSKKTRARK